MQSHTAAFARLLETPGNFVITCEQVPGRESIGAHLDTIVDFARRGAETGLFQAVSITDSPGGIPALSPDLIAAEIEATGMPAIIHFSAKDLNRNAAESRLLALDRRGLGTLLVMSGDYPMQGHAGQPMPVFDLDPVHILTLITLMNCGWRVGPEGYALAPCQATSFYAGAVVAPAKATDAELWLQFAKVEKKLRAGARYLVTQVGPDFPSLEKLMSYLGERNLTVPVLGNVFVLRKGAAAAMHRGDIPGIILDDALVAAIDREAGMADKGKGAALDRAARQIAVMKGMGLRGAHLGGLVLTYGMVEEILGKATEYAPSWRELVPEFSPSPRPSVFTARKRRSGWLQYRVMRVLHDLFFIKEGLRGAVMRGFCRLFDRVKLIGAVVHCGEYVTKRVLFGCKDCGDCALPEMQFLCPQSQCPKQQRNGPCGGSRFDACEVHPERPCVWVRVQTRAAAFGELDALRQSIIGPRNWKLRDTSAWVTYHLDRDHTGYDYAALGDKTAKGI